MKRFLTLSLFTLALCVGVTLLSHASIDKKVVKTELNTHYDSLVVMAFDLNYISEATLEVLAEWTPKIIGKISEGVSSKVFRPPVINATYHLFAYSKRF